MSGFLSADTHDLTIRMKGVIRDCQVGRCGAARHAPGGAQLLAHAHGLINRDGKRNAHEAPRARINLAVDAHHFTTHVDQGAAGVAGVDGAVDLDHVKGRAVNIDGAVDAGDDALAHRERQLAERVADSGDGFADLAGFDSDSNGWIDEGDTVFAKLKLWIKDDTGADKLVDLKSSGVGALYLGRASTDFSLTDAGNQELGQTRATGIYLNENGSGGTLQQVDLAV